jgi:hypothetical protein
MLPKLGLSTFAFALALHGCAAAPRTTEPSPILSADRVNVRHYVWTGASCSDGAIDLAALGFERTLELERTPDAMLLTLETALATRGCRSTSVWKVSDATEGKRIEPEAWVIRPSGDSCGLEERAAVLGTLRFLDERLEITTRSSPWCRGLDARFRYIEAPVPALDAERIAARYVAHFARGDADALARLFALDGSLIEPFSATEDGQLKRHEGRDAVRAYYQRAFASVPWQTARLLALEPDTATGAMIAEVEYMDGLLAEPLRLRIALVLAGYELLEAEMQLVTDPRAAVPVASVASAARVEQP